MSNIAERIAEFIKDNNLNYRSFSIKIGVSDVAVRNAALGETKPGYEFLAAIAVSFPNINLHWLITGEGPRHIPEVRSGEYLSLKEIIRLVQENEKDLKKVSSFLSMVTRWAEENLVLDSIIKEIEELKKQVRALKQGSEQS